MTYDDPAVTAALVLSHEAVPGGFVRRCKVPDNLYYFKGHFTGAPVVAGVVQLKWVADAVAELTGAPLQLHAMEALKFHQLLFPGQEFLLTLTWDEGRRKWTFRITSDGQKIASGRLAV